jgi:hypothetical protein
MKILIICPDFDCAGVAWNLRKAINKYTSHEARHITGATTFWAQNTDMIINQQNKQAIDNLVAEADILHFNLEMWSPDRVPKDKKVFFHFHSGTKEAVPETYLEQAKAINARLLCCAPPEELCLNATWIPNVLEIKDIPQAHYNGGAISICASHDKNNQLKNIEVYESHIFHMIERGYPIKLNLVWNKPKHEAFQIRSQSQIALENMVEGYIGMNGWEAMAMRQVVIGRLSNYTKIKYAELGENIPIISGESIQEIDHLIRGFVKEPGLLIDCMQESRAWMERFYAPEIIVDKYIKEYEK